MPSKSVSSTPYEIWNERKPNLKHLKNLGCLTYIKNIFGHKLNARSDKYWFVEYLNEINRYYFNHPTEQKVFVSGHVTFLKHEFIQGGCGRNIEFMKVHDLQTDPKIPVVGP